MSTHNTGNPLGSAKPEDLFDNSQNIDKAANDLVAATWPDRFGRDRVTLSEYERRAQSVVDGAQQQINDATFRRPFDTLAEADAWALANVGDRTDVYLVLNDPSAWNRGSFKWDGSKLAKTELQPASTEYIDEVGSRVAPVLGKSIFGFADPNGYLLGYIRGGESVFPEMEARAIGEAMVARVDRRGNVGYRQSSEKLDIGPLSVSASMARLGVTDIRQTAKPNGLMLTDGRGYLAQSELMCSGLELHPTVEPLEDAWVEGSIFHMPTSVMHTAAGPVNIPAQSLSISVPASSPFAHSYALRYSTELRAGLQPGEWLQAIDVSNLVITRASNGAALVAGTDYALAYGSKVRGIPNVVEFQVAVSYVGRCQRYDLVQVDVENGAVSIKPGTDRFLDPEEFAPKPDPGKVAVYMLHVQQGSALIVPMFPWQYGQNLPRQPEAERLLKYNRRALAAITKRLRNGSAVRIAGYGDSQTAFAGSGSIAQLSPGGNRDRLFPYFVRYPSGTLAGFPRFDGTDPDFSGSAFNDHIKEGWCWELIRSLRTAYSSPIAYANWGIPGTTSANTLVGGTYHGSHPARLGALVASAPDLVVVAFGMNEAFATDTLANMVNIISACQGTGATVVVMGCPRPNGPGGGPDVVLWEKLNLRLWAAAVSQGAAFISPLMIESDKDLGSSGLSIQSLCNANFFNHPGRVQLRALGNALSAPFLE